MSKEQIIKAVRLLSEAKNKLSLSEYTSDNYLASEIGKFLKQLLSLGGKYD